MTLCVAITVPTQKLNPYRRPLRFSEPGIVFAADARYSFLDQGTVRDEGVKLWELSDQSVAAFSGTVELAEKSLCCASQAIEDYHFREHEEIARATQTALRYVSAKTKGDAHLDVLVGVHDETSNLPFLVRMSSRAGFELARRDGIGAIGAGAEEFVPFFVQELDHCTRQASAPARSGFKIVQEDGVVGVARRTEDDLMDVPLSTVCLWLLSSLDSFVEKCEIKTVGSPVVGCTLSGSGISVLDANVLKNDAWHSITPSQLLTWSEMGRRKYRIPRMREDFTFDD